MEQMTHIRVMDHEENYKMSNLNAFEQKIPDSRIFKLKHL